MSLSTSFDYLSASVKEKLVIFKVYPNVMSDESSDDVTGVNGFLIGITPYHAKCLMEIPDNLTEQEEFLLEGIDIDWNKIPGLHFCGINRDASEELFGQGWNLVDVAKLGTGDDFRRLAKDRAVLDYVYYSISIDIRCRCVNFRAISIESPIEVGYFMHLYDFSNMISGAYEKLNGGRENA